MAATLTSPRATGHAPLVATRHTAETLQCNRCKTSFTAPLPEALQQDGVNGRSLYSYSAVAIVCIYRCFAGVPMHRQQNLQKSLGVHVPDASIWDMCERMADILRPVRRYLFDKAANAPLFFGDDTGATILDQRAKLRPNRKTGKDVLRTGCHTTCVIATIEGGLPAVLFTTGIHHTGEVMDLILAKRNEALPPPIFMGDCIESNTVTAATIYYAGCNAHAIRRFKALTEKYPEHTDYVLSRYRQIYDHEETCKKSGMTDEQRLDDHKQYSRPLLREITEYGEDLFEQRRVEPNSDLGQAFEYIINHERRLSAFARHPGAPLDNNSCERTLRICVRLRETARFFRNPIGASVADTLLTVGGTAQACDANLMDYFVAAQRHADDVRQHPELWVPVRCRGSPRCLVPGASSRPQSRRTSGPARRAPAWCWSRE